MRITIAITAICLAVQVGFCWPGQYKRPVFSGTQTVKVDPKPDFWSEWRPSSNCAVLDSIGTEGPSVGIGVIIFPPDTIRAVWINPAGEPWTSYRLPDYEVGDTVRFDLRYPLPRVSRQDEKWIVPVGAIQLKKKEQ